jgi:hypothetical protein
MSKGNGNKGNENSKGNSNRNGKGQCCKDASGGKSRQWTIPGGSPPQQTNRICLDGDSGDHMSDEQCPKIQVPQGGQVEAAVNCHPVAATASGSKPVATNKATYAPIGQPVAEPFVQPVAANVRSRHPAICVYISNAIRIGGNSTWRCILSGHMHVKKDAVFFFVDDVDWEGTWYRLVTVSLPNSFERNDGAACSARVVASSMGDCSLRDAVDWACRDLVLELIIMDALTNYPQSKMVLHKLHWTKSIPDMLRTIGAKLGLSVRKQLLLTIPSGHNNDNGLQGLESDPYCSMNLTSHYEEEPDSRIAREAEVRDLPLRSAATAGEWVNPASSWLWNKQHIWWDGKREMPHTMIARLLVTTPGALLQDIRQFTDSFEVHWLDYNMSSSWCFRKRPDAEQLVVAPPLEAKTLPPQFVAAPLRLLSHLEAPSKAPPTARPLGPIQAATAETLAGMPNFLGGHLVVLDPGPLRWSLGSGCETNSL